MSIGSSAMVIEVEQTTIEIRVMKYGDARGKKDKISGDIRLEQMTR